MLLLKAKLEAIAQGHSTVDQEFLAHILIPGGGTVNDAIVPLLDKAYATGTPLLQASNEEPML